VEVIALPLRCYYDVLSAKFLQKTTQQSSLV